MQELIKITTKGDQQLVSARDVHAYLEVKKHFTEWFDDNKVMFTDGVDYQAFHLEVKAGPGTTRKVDYSMTLDCAKEMCMMSKVAKGKQARQYFIECEKQLKGKVVSLPDYPEALRQLAQTIEYSTKLQQQINEAKPAIDFYETVATSDDTMSITDAAKILNYGPHKLFKILRENKLLDYENVAYQRGIDAGWFKVIEYKYRRNSGGTGISKQTLVYQKGLQYIKKLLDKKQAA